MKEKAKKLLALIMAMAMCLSLLQGVAFAAEGDIAADSSTPAASDSSEPAAEENETITAVDLKKQDPESKGYSVVLSDDTTENRPWTEKSDYVTHAETHRDAYIGKAGVDQYVVTLKGDESKQVTYETEIPAKTLEDSDLNWADVKAYPKGDQERKGQLYVEKQKDEEVYYFRLYAVKGNNYDTSKWVYAKNTAKDGSGAWTQVDKDGKEKDAGKIESGEVATIKKTDAVEKFEFDFKDIHNVKEADLKADGHKIVLEDVSETGTFKVKVVDVNNNEVVTDLETVKAQMAELSSNGTVADVNGPDADNYFSVIVKPIAGENFGTGESKPDEKTNTKNYSTYKWNEKNKKSEDATVIGLVDTGKDGTYKKNHKDTTNDKNYTTDEKIAAGTPVLGKLKVTEIPQGIDLNSVKVGDEFKTVEELQNKAVNLDDTKDLVIKTKQEILNDKVNGVTNNAKNRKTQDTSVTIAKAKKHYFVKKYEDKAATCKVAGYHNEKTVCQYCGYVAEEKNTVLPVVDEKLLKNEEDEKTWVVKEEEAKAAKSGHWVKRYEVDQESIKLATKSEKGSYVVKYYCNLGEEHEELRQTVTIDKLALEHSYKYDQIDWGTQNTNNSRDPEALFGWKPVVYDTDKDLTDVRMVNDGVLAGADRASEVKRNEEYQSDDYDATETVGDQYYYNVTVKNVKNGDKECVDGSAQIVVNVYKSNKKGTDTLVHTFTKDYAIPAHKTHSYVTTTTTDANGKKHVVVKCDVCGEVLSDSDVDGKKDDTNPDETAKTSISDAVIKGSAPYRGEYFNVPFTVTLDGKKLALNKDYVITNTQQNNFKGVGSHKITIEGIGSYTGVKSGKLYITETAQNVTVTPAKKTFTVKTLKKKAASFKISVKGAKGAVSYKSNNKKVTVSKAGKVTVKKGTKKGTYKVTVKVAKKGGFKAATKTVTIVVK